MQFTARASTIRVEGPKACQRRHPILSVSALCTRRIHQRVAPRGLLASSKLPF